MMNLIFCRRAFFCVGMMIGGVVAANPWAQSPVECYVVPAMSSEQRLPHKIPTDGQLGDQLHVIAAQGEFEPVSFVMVPRQNVERLELKAEALRGPADGAVIPVENIDIKVVKVWYQGGTSWYSYFADTNRRELVPELLLNDETLVKVDYENKENYLRIGDEYVWVSYPKEKAEKEFDFYNQMVQDAKTLQPVKLVPGENKQIWVTLKVPEQATAGIYSGKIRLIADGRDIGAMTLTVRVLPFSLPLPKTYYDLDKDFLVTMYSTSLFTHARRRNIDPEYVKVLQRAIFKNLKDHNVLNPFVQGSLNSADDTSGVFEADVKFDLGVMKELGFPMQPLITHAWAYFGRGESLDDLSEYRKRVERMLNVLREEAGHSDNSQIYLSTWDEAGLDRVKGMRKLSEVVHELGGKVWVTTHRGRHFDYGGYAFDYSNHGGWPSRDHAAIWHSVGSKIASYAGPHTGPENPDTFRRWEGIARYKANYDGSFNYKYYSLSHTDPNYDLKNLKTNPWNDFHGDAFRKFNLVHIVRGGVIDTLAWEGFREGIDDIRYATKLKQVAAEAIESGRLPAMHTAKKALMWMELFDDKSIDLNEVRMEMISYILKIQGQMAQSSQEGK